MRKKVIAIICAMVFVLALPAMAFAATNSSPADPEPVITGGVDSNGDTISDIVTTETTNADGDVVVNLTATARDANGNETEEIQFNVTAPSSASDLTVGVSPVNASNFDLTAADYIAKRSFVVSSDSYDGSKIVTIVYTTDPNYTGLTCYAYIQHSDGTTEVQTLPIDRSGNVTLTMDKLSIVSFAVVNKAYGTSLANTASDTSSTSPKTGGFC